jgi:hypothetical protein
LSGSGLKSSQTSFPFLPQAKRSYSETLLKRSAPSFPPFVAFRHLNHHLYIFKFGIHRTLTAGGQKKSAPLAHLVYQPLAVAANFVGRSQGQKGCRDIAADAHMPVKDFLGLEDVGGAVKVTDAFAFGQLP